MVCVQPSRRHTDLCVVQCKTSEIVGFSSIFGWLTGQGGVNIHSEGQSSKDGAASGQGCRHEAILDSGAGVLRPLGDGGSGIDPRGRHACRIRFYRLRRQTLPFHNGLTATQVGLAGVQKETMQGEYVREPAGAPHERQGKGRSARRGERSSCLAAVGDTHQCAAQHALRVPRFARPGGRHAADLPCPANRRCRTGSKAV